MSSNRREFIRQLGGGVVGMGLLSTLPFPLDALGAPWTLPRSSPEQQGMSSSGILDFLKAVDFMHSIERSNTEFHSLMIIRHGHVVTEGWWSPYAPSLKHTMYSLSKSFTSSAVGMAIAEKHFTLESPVISFFPDERPKSVSDNLAEMKVKDLLTMTAGHAKDTILAMRAAPAENWPKLFLSLPVDYKPGTHFLYNTGATYMLSAIIQKTTAKSLMDYAKPRLFTPLGIEGMDWESDAQGITVGGFGLRVKTEDIAKFGLLYLQNGKWDGKQLLSESWIKDATQSHIDSSPATRRRAKDKDDWSQGYGYQFWRCRNDAFRADGAFGQFCIVMPKEDAVIAITSESFDLQVPLDMVWNYLLPAMNPKTAADESTQATVRSMLKNLSLEIPKINASGSAASRISDLVFTLDQNEFNAKSVSFRFMDDQCIFTLYDSKGEHVVNCGIHKWKEEKNAKTQVLFPMAGRPEVSTPLVASATWQDDQTLLMTWRYTETAHSDRFLCKFEDNKVTIRFLNSVSKGNPDSPEKRAPLTGVVK